MLCRFHPLTDKVGVLVHKVYDALVVFGVLVVLAVALHHLECPQIHLYGFNYLTANPCREYEGVGFLVVFTAEHADVLCLALAVILVYAFKYLDDYFLVSDYQSEEFGFVGASLILALVFFLILRIILVGIRAKDPFNSMMAIGIGGMILVQVFVNIGGISGLIPSTGVTFPFLSQGGNSLLVLSVAIAFVLNIDASEKRARLYNELETQF